MGLYDRDYMRWTDGDRQRYLGRGDGPAASRAHPAVLIAALVSLAAALIGAKIGLGIGLPGSRPEPAHPAPIGCVGPSSAQCPPGSVRIRDPRDPNNPNEWPNDLHRLSPSPSV